jgi:hypothetical protein
MFPQVKQAVTEGGEFKALSVRYRNTGMKVSRCGVTEANLQHEALLVA